MPETNDRAFIQDLVVADVEERKEFGVRKYGTALQSGNGRDMLQDAYEEALDLVMYLRGMKDEDHHLELELQRVRRERNDLINWAQRRAAPLQYTATGTIHSAMHNLGTYLDMLEAIAQEAKDQTGDHCSSHTEHEDSCSTCVMVDLLRRLGK